MKNEMPTGRTMLRIGNGRSMPEWMEQVDQRACKEVVVLEIAHHPQAHHYAQDEQPAAALLVFAAIDQSADGVVGERREGKEKTKPPIPGRIKEVAGAQHEELPRARVRQEQPTGSQNDREENSELNRGKDHAGGHGKPGYRSESRPWSRPPALPCTAEAAVADDDASLVGGGP